jgi:hypothetical protein
MHQLILVCCLLVAVAAPIALAGPWANGEGRESAEEYNSMDMDDSFEHALQRRGDFCARWGDSCVPDAKVKFAKCCAGMRCDCGSAILGGGKCQCKKESVFGR